MQIVLRQLRRVLKGCALVWAGTGALAADVTVFAAASTQTALTEIADVWRQQTGGDVTLSFAGTSALARQIEAGAPADLFLAASADWMDHLSSQGLLVDVTRRDLLGNTLALVGPSGAPPLSLSDADAFRSRLKNGRLAVALVDAVPAGIYARSALTTLGLWDVAAANLAQTDNVRAALALVALGAAPLGMVYASDARAEPRVALLAEIPAETHAPIVYPVAATSSGDVAAATAFLDFLKSDDAGAAFARQGFSVLDAP